jgi:hypothetical protein
MNPSEIVVGRVYQVWMSRKLRPVLIQRKTHTGWIGRVWPGGRSEVRIRNAEKVSQEYHDLNPHRFPVDYKSRAAGERDDD